MSDTDAFFGLVSKGDMDGVRALLDEAPILAELKNGSGSTALQWAAYHRQTAMVAELLRANPAVDIWTASSIGKIDSVTPLSSINELSQDGFTPLGLAAAFGHNDILRFLIKNGADVNMPSKALGQVPPLQSAVFGRNYEGLSLLLDAGANVNSTQSGDFTALMGASQNGDARMVQTLLEHGANPKYANCDRRTALDMASSDEVRSILDSAVNR